MAEQPLLARNPLFAEAPRRDLETLERAARLRTFNEGEIIFHQEDPGDGLYIIKLGTVKISVLSLDGQESVVALMFPGDCFGEMAVLDETPRSATATALERTETLFLRRSDFTAFLERSPKVMMNIINLLCQRLRRTDELVTELVFFDVYSRVAKKLLELADRHGVRGEHGIEINLTLTQQDLANIVGASRESVNKVMRFYRDKGLVAVTNQRISILDAGGLQMRLAPTSLFRGVGSF